MRAQYDDDYYNDFLADGDGAFRKNEEWKAEIEDGFDDFEEVENFFDDGNRSEVGSEVGSAGSGEGTASALPRSGVRGGGKQLSLKQRLENNPSLMDELYQLDYEDIVAGTTDLLTG